jgi:hypothetical protein
MTSRKGGIIRRMIRIYRMWRFVKVVENKIMYATDKDKPVYLIDCAIEFCSLRTFPLGRHYNVNDGFRAELMADKRGYTSAIDRTVPFKKRVMGISGDGVEFTSLASLLNEMAKSVGAVVPITISVIAIVVSIIALSHHR